MRCPIPNRWSSLAVLLVSLGFTADGFSQQSYRLVVPGGTESRAELTPQTLLVDSAGGRHLYRRSSQYDTPDGRWIAYQSAALGKVIRWPRSNAGNFQIGTIALNGTVSFRPSAMQVVAVAGRPPGIGQPVLPGPQPIAGDFRLASVESAPLSMALQVDGRRQAVMLRSGATPDRIWSIRDVGRGYYRIQTVLSGRAVSLASLQGSTSVSIAPAARSTNQLWMIHTHPADGSLLIENAAVAGRVLAGGRDGIVALERISNADAQRWRAIAHSPAVGFRPAMKTVSHEVHPNPALPPADIELKNRHENELWVLIQDRRPGGRKQRVKIPANGSVRVALDRDPGATVVEAYELLTPGGLYERQEFVTELPPATYYDLSVYETILQSITVDRRGTTSKIQDVNYQPKSLGWFLLPPADFIRAGSLDVYTMAREAKNAGGVRRLEMEFWDPKPKKDPLQEILDDVQRRAPKP